MPCEMLVCFGYASVLQIFLVHNSILASLRIQLYAGAFILCKM